jgi:polyisoprenoid-binding protein YceI
MKTTIMTGIIILLGSISSIEAQKYFTREAQISFFSDAPLEKIEADNGTGTCVVDFDQQRMEFAVLIKAFQFEKALMQEHFNENYMESHKFPKATFKGEIIEPASIDMKDQPQDVKVKGTITIHGVDREITAPGTILYTPDKVKMSSIFTVAVKDFDIEIPGVVRDNIAKEVEISIDAALEPIK